MRVLVRNSLLAGFLGVEAFISTTAAVSGGGDVQISQRDKQFQPGAITVAPGQPVVIVNDDGGTVHHAYVESDTFNFDSGDQTPGTRTRIIFPSKGDFRVLCGIHPKMKLDVHVR